MATGTKMKPDTKPAPAVVTFAEINARKVRERIEAYRNIVQRRATGEIVTVSDMERAAELLEQLGLPQYTFDRDVEAMQRFKAATDKVQAAIDAAPAHKQRAEELVVEIEAARKRLEILKEEHRLVTAKANKPTTYGQTVAMLKHDHPHVLGSITDAVRFRVEELDRRRGTLEVAGT
jgi:hypothetical protein